MDDQEEKGIGSTPTWLLVLRMPLSDLMNVYLGHTYIYTYIHACRHKKGFASYQQLSAWLTEGKRSSLAGTGKSVTSKLDMF